MSTFNLVPESWNCQCHDVMLKEMKARKITNNLASPEWSAAYRSAYSMLMLAVLEYCFNARHSQVSALQESDSLRLVEGGGLLYGSFFPKSMHTRSIHIPR